MIELNICDVKSTLSLPFTFLLEEINGQREDTLFTDDFADPEPFQSHLEAFGISSEAICQFYLDKLSC